MDAIDAGTGFDGGSPRNSLVDFHTGPRLRRRRCRSRQGGIDKCIFVGSPEDGKIVMELAEELDTCSLGVGHARTPSWSATTALQSYLDRISQIRARGVFQSMGQNCRRGRFFVGSKVYEGFCPGSSR